MEPVKLRIQFAHVVRKPIEALPNKHVSSYTKNETNRLSSFGEGDVSYIAHSVCAGGSKTNQDPERSNVFSHFNWEFFVTDYIIFILLCIFPLPITLFLLIPIEIDIDKQRCV